MLIALAVYVDSGALAADAECNAWGESITVNSGGPVSEPSGLVSVAGRIYTHSDGEALSGAIAKLYYFEEALGGVYEQDVLGATNTDWEDLGLGPCDDGGECLYIGDFGDNDKEREDIVIWRVPVSDADEVEAEECRLAYPDGKPQDVEAMLVFPDGSVEIVTKEKEGDARVFRVPSLDCDGETHVLGDVGNLEVGFPITGGAVNADGTLVALRSDDRAWVWRGCTLDWSAEAVEISLPDEPNGEAIAFDETGNIYTAWEGVRAGDVAARTQVAGEGDFTVHVRECEGEAELTCPDCGCGTGAAGGWGVLGATAAGLLARRKRAPTGTGGRETSAGSSPP